MKPIPLSRRKALLAAAPDTTVRVYTLQHAAAWEAATARGYLTGEPLYAEPYFMRSYGWMRFQMSERLTAFSGDFPIWAWLKRPNMRQWHFDKEPGVMIVADVPLARLLLSDYDAWHAVLNNWWVSISEEEDDRFEKDGVIPSETWPRIFDILGSEPGLDRRWAGSKAYLQACVDRIYLDEVVRTRVEQGRTGRNRRARS